MNVHPTLTPDADPTLLRGDGRYGFTAQIEGDDLVVRGVRATWFGGAHDPCDSGETASGISTRRHPEMLGCALPMSGHRLTRGSPLPNLPWMTTLVQITCHATGRSVTVPLIDLGPSAPPHAHAAIDLTHPAFLALGGDLNHGSLTVDFRLPGAALRLPATILLAARSFPGKEPMLKRAANATDHAPRPAGPGVPSPAPVPLLLAAADAAGGSAVRLRELSGAVTTASGGAAADSVGLAAPRTRGAERMKDEG